jgi:hypothetical protein
VFTASGVMIAGLCVLTAAPSSFQAVPSSGQQGPSMDAFVLVSGDGYQGAIIPARTGAYVVGAVGAWTPAPDDAAAFEKALRKYAAVGPPVVGTPPSADSDLRSLFRSLPDYRRQYIGTTKAGHRALHVTACRVSACNAWQKEPIGGIDMGCWIWMSDFDVTEQRITKFGCQGRGGHLRSVGRLELGAESSVSSHAVE